MYPTNTTDAYTQHTRERPTVNFIERRLHKIPYTYFYIVHFHFYVDGINCKLIYSLEDGRKLWNASPQLSAHITNTEWIHELSSLLEVEHFAYAFSTVFYSSLILSSHERLHVHRSQNSSVIRLCNNNGKQFLYFVMVCFVLLWKLCVFFFSSVCFALNFVVLLWLFEWIWMFNNDEVFVVLLFLDAEILEMQHFLVSILVLLAYYKVTTVSLCSPSSCTFSVLFYS